MTTTTLTKQQIGTGPSPLTRIARVARLMLVNRSTVFGIPLSILAVIFLATYLIWLVISINIERSGGEPDGTEFYVGGGSFYIVVYMLVVAVQAINLTFRFAQSLSVTRRDFYLGTALAFVGLSVGYSVLMGVLGWVEDATNGWGLHGQMFSLGYLGVANPIETFYVFLMTFLLFSFIGMAVATLYVRWRAFGLLGFFGGSVVLLVGLIALFTLTDFWPQVGEWFVRNGAVGLATWTLIPTVIAGVSGLLILRKATPGN